MSSINHIPVYYQAAAKTAGHAISEFDYAILAAHVNPDGDALGSLSACGFLLKCLEREFAIFCPQGVPHYLDFLPLPGPVYQNLADLPFEPQCAIYLDCSQLSRLGPALAEIAGDLPSINIDHHLTDVGLGSVANFIEPGAAATSQLMAYVVLAMGMPLDGDLARGVALGLMTDTGGFCHGNTSADVFALCALLAHNGCSFADLRERLEHNWKLDKVRLWGDILSHVKLEDHGHIAIGAVSRAKMEKFHCAAEDLEGLVEWFRKIRGVLVSALVREEKNDLCKFSLRSFGCVDVRSMAAELGGGGHRNAAGGTIAMPLGEAARTLKQVITSQLNNPSR